jgi:PIN domain nuclease of toxin-antitoxin system
VLDASALLALLNREAGAAQVAGKLDVAWISTVNWAEVVQKAIERGVARGPAEMREDLMAMGLELREFTAAQAEVAAGMWPSTRSIGLSLADRACLALALQSKAAVLTADRAWAGLVLGLDIQVIR